MIWSKLIWKWPIFKWFDQTWFGIDWFKIIWSNLIKKWLILNDLINPDFEITKWCFIEHDLEMTFLKMIWSNLIWNWLFLKWFDQTWLGNDWRQLADLPFPVVPQLRKNVDFKTKMNPWSMIHDSKQPISRNIKGKTSHKELFYFWASLTFLSFLTDQGEDYMIWRVFCPRWVCVIR